MLKAGVFLQNRYEIIYRIGSGGMADVYKAKDHKLNRFVAVKVLKQEFRDDKAFLSKFRVEAQAAAGMSHPNIVNVYDVGEDRGVSFIVMELVEGITLKTYIGKKGKLPVREAASIALQVAAGLEAAHNNGIVHRDVKPQNILISMDGKAKVADFGIARAANSNTISSSAMGSVHYSSPEQTRGGYSDAKGDIYSMGITMFEMLTGRVPFDGDSTVEVALHHLQEDVPSARKFTPEIPFAVEQIVLKCTQRSPDRRYANMSELIRDLKEALVNPNGNFVKIPAVDRKAHTVMLSQEEMDQIKSRSMPSYDSSLDTGAAARLKEDGSVAGDGRDYAYGGDYYRSSSYQRIHENEIEKDIRIDREEDYPANRTKVSSDTHEYNREAARAETDREYMPLHDESYDDEYADNRGGGHGRSGERILIIFAVLAAAGIAAVILLTAGRSYGLIGRNTPTAEEDEKVTVPDLLDRSESEAVALLSEAGLSYKYQGESPSSTYAKGQVVSQSVAADSYVEKGTVVGYVLSSGSDETLTIPSLIDSTQSEAEEALTSMGLQVVVDTSRYSSTIEEGHIINTNPGAGSAAVSGDTVTIYVSQGPDTAPVEVLNVTGHYVSEAQTALSGRGLYVFITEETSDTVEEGIVISQDVAGGTMVPAGTSITLTVSAGSGEEEAAAAADPNVAWTCNAQLSTPEGYNGEPVRIVLEQEGVQTTIFEGTTTFPYILNVTGQTGVSTGTVYVYTLNASTWEIIQTTEYDNVVFSPES